MDELLTKLEEEAEGQAELNEMALEASGYRDEAFWQFDEPEGPDDCVNVEEPWEVANGPSEWSCV